MKIYLTINYYSKSYPEQRGLTLVELMIALTIGLIILVALGQLFVTSRSTYTMGEGLARTQESGRFAMEYLAQDLRMAGYAGCSNPTQGAGTVSGNGAGTTCSTNFCNMVNPSNAASTMYAEGVYGYSYIGSGGSNAVGDWSPALPSTFFIDGEVAPNTDVILIQYASATNMHITGNATPDNANVKVNSASTSDPQFVQNDVIIVSDCKNTDIYRVTNNPGAAGSGVITLTSGSSGNYSSHLSHSYGNDAEVLRLVTRVYFIRNNAGREPSLTRKELISGGAIGAAQELVDGIEDMRILYGVDTDAAPGDGIANRYAKANEVGVSVGTSWNDVVNVRVGLLIRTPANVDQTQDTNTYELVDGITVDPVNDNRRRQIYRSTVQLRN